MKADNETPLPAPQSAYKCAHGWHPRPCHHGCNDAAPQQMPNCGRCQHEAHDGGVCHAPIATYEGAERCFCSKSLDAARRESRDAGLPVPNDLDAIMARADATPSGPWIYEDVSGGPSVSRVYSWKEDICDFEWSTAEDHAAVGKFIAAARTDIPALVAECRRLRAALPTREQIARALWAEVFLDDRDRDNAERLTGAVPNAKRREYYMAKADAVLALFGAHRSEEQK